MTIKEKVLVAEDEQNIAQFIAAVLSGQGYETVLARSGGEALSMISSHCPDLVILDLGLPDMDGLEVCRKIRPYNQIVGVVRPAFEEEDDMNIDKLTDAEVLALGKRLLAVMGKQPVSPALAAELAEAKARGITDGSSPGAFCTRAQAAVMTLRAVKD